MKFLLALISLVALISGFHLERVRAEHHEAKLPFVEYCKYFGYPVETHFITTDDGYILKFFRVQKKNTTIRKLGLTPIYLQHGLLDSSDTWLLNDEDKAPGFILANKGFDVWMGNNRGNKHSRNHTTLNPDKDKEFWEFTFQHMADYDLPAAFRYIAGQTQQKINYIGHSQGTMQMHVTLAKQNPVVESLLDKYFGFGPVAYIIHQESHILSLLDKTPIVQWYELRHIHEFMPSMGWFETDAGALFCSDFPHICGDLFTQLMDGDPTVDNYERYDVVAGHDPSGTSVMNMKHWKQMLDKKKFEAYDYGSAAANTKHYGQPTPPLWDVSNYIDYSEKIRVPLRLFGGTSDLLADVTDLNQFWSDVNPEVRKFLRIYNAGHCTFMWGLDVQPWMNDVLSFF